MDTRKKRNRKVWSIIGVIAVALTALISYYAMRPATFAYERVKAQTGNIVTYYSFSGNVVSKYRQTIIAKTIAQISEIYVEEGDMVKQGDVLIETAMGDKVEANINGEVTTISVEQNKQVTPGTHIMEIVDFNNLKVVFKVDEYDVGELGVGKEAIVYIPAIDEQFTGIINDIAKEGQIANGVTFYTSTIDVKYKGNMRVGMSAEVKLLSNKAENVVLIPMSALHFDERNTPYVFKNGNNNSVISQQVTTGINDGVYVEIKSGISSGEDILYKNDIALEDLFFPEGGKNIKFDSKGDRK